MWIRVLTSFVLCVIGGGVSWNDALAEEVESDVPVRVDDLQSMGVAAVAMNDFVYRIEGEGAFFLVNTSEGAVLVDTGTSYAQNEEQMKLVRELASGPIRKIIVTHAHGDHSGGLPRFKEQIDAGEITDKGYINQRAVLTRRADLVERLYTGNDDDIVVVT